MRKQGQGAPSVAIPVGRRWPIGTFGHSALNPQKAEGPLNPLILDFKGSAFDGVQGLAPGLASNESLSMAVDIIHRDLGGLTLPERE